MVTEFEPELIVHQVTEHEVNELKDHPIHDYVSVLAERAVQKHLKHE